MRPCCMALHGLCPIHTPEVCQAMDAKGTEQSTSVLQNGASGMFALSPSVL